MIYLYAYISLLKKEITEKLTVDVRNLISKIQSSDILHIVVKVHFLTVNQTNIIFII